MFTGLVEIKGVVIEVVSQPPGCRIALRAAGWSDVVLGESIAVAGCCLSVVAIDGDVLAFDAGPETLRLTTLGVLRRGSEVNLERSLRVGDRMGGHFVTGHVDAVGTLERRDDEGEWSTFWFRVPPAQAAQMARKGSVAVDGVSLTLVDVEPERFSVMLIPHTLAMTTLGKLAACDRVNIETDLLAKYVQQAGHAG
ncbi:MAG TPA: riboflavin synthase [Pirellulales bacterium]|jgi:riboflavin synthase|nr:riboflavin synthase [Pirellulales bacterium]